MSIIVSASMAKLSPISSQPVEHGIVLGLQTEYNPVPLYLFGNCADISYLKEQFKLHQIRDVCTLLTRELACNGMIRMLPYQFKNNGIESLRNRQKT